MTGARFQPAARLAHIVRAHGAIVGVSLRETFFISRSEMTTVAVEVSQVAF